MTKLNALLSLLLIYMTAAAWAVNLDQAVEATMQKNETVGQSKEQLRQAEEQVRQTRGAIFPNLSLNGTYLQQPKLSDSTQAALFPDQSTTWNLSLTQPLFRGLREFGAVRRQKEFYEAQRLAYASKLMALYQQVAQAYMNVLALEQDLRNLDAQQKIYQTRVKDLRGRVGRGESSASEVLTAQSTSAALDAEVLIQRSRLISARENLSLLTGLPIDTVLTDDTEVEASQPLQPLKNYLDRIEERPDVKAQKANVQVSEEDVGIAKGAHLPSVDLTGNYYFERPKGVPEDLKWDVQLRLTLPIYEGGVTQSRVRQAASKRSESELSLAQLRRQSEAEIKSLYESVRMRDDQLKALKQSSELSEKNYQTLLRDSGRGLIRSIDVQLGLTEYRLARRSYDQARYESRLEKIRLELAAAYIPSQLAKELQ